MGSSHVLVIIIICPTPIAWGTAYCRQSSDLVVTTCRIHVSIRPDQIAWFTKFIVGVWICLPYFFFMMSQSRGMPLYSVQTGINCLPYITNQPRESSRQTLVDPRYPGLGLVPVNLDFVPASASLAPGIHSSWKKKREGRKKEKRKHPVGDGDDGWVEVAGVCPRNRFLASITQWRALFFLTFARCKIGRAHV